MNLLISLFGLVLLVASSISEADMPDTANTFPPEVTVGSIHCKAEWNEFCEDQKTIQVPSGYKLCKNTVMVKEQSGDSTYAITDTNISSVTVKFSAKGNRNRLKPEGALIDLAVSLQGVRTDDDCAGNATIVPKATNIDPPKPEPDMTAPPAPANEYISLALKAKVTPPPPPKPVTLSAGAKINACACSQMIDADKVTRCLTYGQTRDKGSCDTLGASLQCVATKADCRELQKAGCVPILGIDKTNSQQRIYVPDSPYCELKLEKK
jgi:hypothetical protein